MAEQLSATEELQLGLSRALYGVARVLRLGKLRDLLSSALLGPDATVYLLGRRYCCPPHATEAQQEEVGASVLSYRTGQAIHATQQHRRLVTALLRRRRRCPVGCRQASARPPFGAGPGAHAAALSLHPLDDVPHRLHAHCRGRCAAAQRRRLGLHAAQVGDHGRGLSVLCCCLVADYMPRQARCDRCCSEPLFDLLCTSQMLLAEMQGCC